MCIAIYKTENNKLTEETLKNCWDANPDGAGFMYVDNNKVKIVKGLMTYTSFREAYDPIALKQAVLHFRIATHGNVDELNTHPFAISDKLGLVHNGIINNIKCDIDSTKSDTWHFVEKIMKSYQNFWQEEAFKALVESFIGYSKLILLNNKGDVEIYNESNGYWDAECWFSNKSYQNKVYTPYSVPKAQQTNAWKSSSIALGKEYNLSMDEEAIGYEKKVKIPKGSKVKVEAFGQGIHVWVVCTEQGIPEENYRAKVNIYCLEDIVEPFTPLTTLHDFKINSEVIFASNYNHFRVGDIVKVESVSPTSLVISDNKGKTQGSWWVPKDRVRPLSLFIS
jgi:predicted glutamine amidotransferase